MSASACVGVICRITHGVPQRRMLYNACLCRLGMKPIALVDRVLIMALQDHFRPPLSVRRHWHAFVVPLLQHGWQVGRRRMRDLWQQADTLVTPLSERPLWCVTAGLLAGSLLGTALDL